MESKHQENLEEYEILAVRHAESEWNKIDNQRKVDGESKKEMKSKLKAKRYEPLEILADCLITEEGRNQCNEMAGYLLRYLP